MWKSKAVCEYHKEFLQQGYCILPGVIPHDRIDNMAASFRPLLETRMKSPPDRGPGRYYITLPFRQPFVCDMFFDAYLMEILEGIIGKDPVMCQLAADVPVQGSDYQPIHRDTEGLFFNEEGYDETPPFQLALNFPLCDILTDDIGPLQMSSGTHMLCASEQNAQIASNVVALRPMYMRRGDALLRDVRGLHRGTPNITETPRPMVVVGYSRKWLRRPEVGVRMPRSVYDELPVAGKRLLRFEPVVADEDIADYTGHEAYDASVLTMASGKSIALV